MIFKNLFFEKIIRMTPMFFCDFRLVRKSYQRQGQRWYSKKSCLHLPFLMLLDHVQYSWENHLTHQRLSVLPVSLKIIIFFVEKIDCFVNNSVYRENWRRSVTLFDLMSTWIVSSPGMVCFSWHYARKIRQRLHDKP